MDHTFVGIPSKMTISADMSAQSTTFSSGFNANNTTAIGSGSGTARILTITGSGASPLIQLNASSGTVTFQPQIDSAVGELSITLGNNGSFDVASGATLALTTTISAPGLTITKTGLGTVDFHSSQKGTAFGKLSLSSGAWYCNAAFGLPSTPSSVTADAVTINGGILRQGALYSSGVNRGFTLGTSGGTVEVDSSASFTINGVLAGAGSTASLTKNGTGRLVLSPGNTYGGNTTVNAGFLEVSADSGLGNNSGSTITLNGGTLRNSNATVGGDFLASTRSLVIGASGGTVDVSVSATAFLLYGGTISGTGNNLTKEGAGELRVHTGHNTFGKLAINTGIFTAGASTFSGFDDSFGAVPSSTTDDAISISNGAQLRLAGAGDVTLDSKRGITIGAGGGIIRAAPGRTLTIPGTIKVANPVTFGSTAPTPADSGTIVLGASANTFGNATISAGELIGVTGGSCANSAVTVSAGATNGVKVAGANGQWSCAGLTYNSGTAYADFDFASVTPSTTIAPLKINGNLVNNATVQTIVRNGSSWSAGKAYPLITWTGTGPVDLLKFSKPMLPSGLGANLSLASKTIYLNILICAPNLSYSIAPGLGLRIALADISSQFQSSQTSPSYSFTGVSATSAQNGSVAYNSSTILYSYPGSGSPSSDSFTYTVSDGVNSATATVSLTFVKQSGACGSISVSGGVAQVKLYGIPGVKYDVQRSPDLNNWTTLGSPPLSASPPLTAQGDGTISFTDTNAPGTSAYYRIIQY